MASLACASLADPGGALEIMWRFNPSGREALARLGGWAVLLMVAVALACGTAAIGLWRLKTWGWTAAVAVLTAETTGDVANALVAGDRRTLIGVPIGGLMLWYLLKSATRREFAKRRIRR
jgi:hypothetical protein